VPRAAKVKARSDSNQETKLKKPVVPILRSAEAAAHERQRQATRDIEHAMKGSQSLREIPRAPVGENDTARAIVTERQQHAKQLSDWAVRLEQALRNGLDANVPDELLQPGLMRISELEEQAAEEEAAAQAAAEARAALAAQPLGSVAHLPEGTLVKLRNFTSEVGLYQGCFDVNLSKYNSRMGRVTTHAPPWVIKAPGGSGEGLIPILLDSRSTDGDRSRGVWLAVPSEHLRAL
jgi:hypothetical protein